MSSFAFTSQSFISDCGVSSSLLYAFIPFTYAVTTRSVLIRVSQVLQYSLLSLTAESCLTQSPLDCLDIVFKSVVQVALSTGYEPGVTALHHLRIAPLLPPHSSPRHSSLHSFLTLVLLKLKSLLWLYNTLRFENPCTHNVFLIITFHQFFSYPRWH